MTTSLQVDLSKIVLFPLGKVIKDDLSGKRYGRLFCISPYGTKKDE